MIGQSLVFVCATFALVAGSCIQTPISQGLVSPCGTVSGVGCNGLGVMSSGFGLGSGVGLGLPITDGPSGSPITIAQAPSVTLPAIETPVVSLPSQPIFAPRVISQRCICTKTMVKPQIYQRLVTVPKIQRYLKRTVSPIVESVAFKATPACQSGVGSGSVVGVASAPAVAVASGSACASPAGVVRPGISCV